MIETLEMPSNIVSGVSAAPTSPMWIPPGFIIQDRDRLISEVPQPRELAPAVLQT